MDRVRMGIIGVGNIATLNVPGYLAHANCDVVALCDPRADVLERRAREWRIDRTYTDLDALLARLTEEIARRFDTTSAPLITRVTVAAEPSP